MFLGECLDSLAAQDLADIEFVLVDDDSPDDCAAICHTYVQSDSRFRYVHQQNRGPGPGGGRNGGLSTATGEYLMFVDADDIVLPNTLTDMVHAAQEADADMVTCNTRRLLGGATRRSEFHDISHPAHVGRTTALESPWLVFDATPWNKLFRRRFFDKAVGQWPEKILYEDIHAMTQAHLLSAATAVLPTSHYLWRIRSEGTSITQQAASIGGDLEHLRELRRSSTLIREIGSTNQLEWFSWKALGFDLHWMTRKLGSLRVAQAEELQNAMQATIDTLDQNVFSLLPRKTQRSYEWLTTQPPKTTRRNVRIANNRLKAVSRSLDLARVWSDPEASLRKWSVTNHGVSISISIRGRRRPEPKDWALELHSVPPLGPLSQPALASARAQRTSRSPDGTWVVAFDVETSSFNVDTGSSTIRLAIRNSETQELGEISRSIEDQLRSRAYGQRALVDGARTYFPFADNGRLMVAINHGGSAIDSVEVTPTLLTLRIGHDLAPILERTGLHSNNRHDPLWLRQQSDRQWSIETQQVISFFRSGHPLLFVSGRLTTSPAVPTALRGTHSVIRTHKAGDYRMDSFLGIDGQVALRPTRSVGSEVAMRLAKFRF